MDQQDNGTIEETQQTPEVIEQGPPEQVIDNPTHERTRKFLNVVIN